MKTHWKALSVLGLGLSMNLGAQETRPAGQTIQGAPQSTSNRSGIAGGGGGGGGFGGSSTSYTTRLANVVSRAPSGDHSAIYFEGASDKQVAEMAEDLQVLEYLISRNIDRALGEHATQYRLGVPMLLRGDGRAVQASYLQGFGVLVKISAPFAVVGADEENQKRKESPATASEWEKARRAVKGVDGDNDHSEADSTRYDGRLVATLKKEIFDSLKNASNLRHVKDSEWVAVAISGGGGSRPTAGAYSAYGTGMAAGGMGGMVVVDQTAARPKAGMLTIRVKKSAASGSAADIEKYAQVLSYFDGQAAPTGGGNPYAVRRSSTVAR